MTTYEAKIAARRAHLEAKAESAKQQSTAHVQGAYSAVAGIEMGQPILIGHHSERRHRRALERSDNCMRRAIDADHKAEEYTRKAEAVGTGGISSDDESAIEKLTAQVEQLEKNQEFMKEANKAAKKGIPALVALGFSEGDAKKFMTPDCMRQIGFPAYKLSNNRANIKRIRSRIASLGKLSQREAKKEETGLYTYEENKEENRIMFFFEGKPDEETRSIMKRHAFKWSPRRGAWVRQITVNALYAARYAKEELGNVANKAS